MGYYLEKSDGKIYIRGREIAIIGCGEEGEKLYWELEGRVNHFFDKDKMILQGKRVESFAKISKEFFYLISTAKFYEEIKKILLAMGLLEFEDFIPSLLVEKELCLIYANCYGISIYQGLTSSEAFSTKYYIYPIKPIHLLENAIEEQILQHCNLLIYQDIRPDNWRGYAFSAEYVTSKLNESTKKIIIPNLVGMGSVFFLQGEHRPYVNQDYPFLDKNIDEMLKHGLTKMEITDRICSGETYSKELIMRNLYITVEKFRKRESLWDVKIIEYIMNHYPKSKCFYDIFHPTNDIFNEIVNEILKILDLGSTFFIKGDMGEYEMMMYPEVEHTLGVKWRQSIDRQKYISDYIDSQEAIVHSSAE